MPMPRIPIDLPGASTGGPSAWLTGLLMTALLAWLPCTSASAEAVHSELVEACLMCHEGAHSEAILQGPHGVLSDPRSGFAAQGCGSCHGPSEQHMRRPARGEARAAPDHPFSDQSARIDQGQCLSCHTDTLMHWRGNTHDQADLHCGSCHQVHSPQDPVLERLSESETCFTCHIKQRSEVLRPSAHPLLDGQMVCSDCHAAHGGIGPQLLTASNVNETCYTCHAEMRGPFLWEHPPVREDCMNCHLPHGSVHEPLLTQRGPWLCQQCHLAQFHPSAALSGSGLPGDTLPSGSASLIAGNCQNCHAHVHGSNHPSGASTTR